MEADSVTVPAGTIPDRIVVDVIHRAMEAAPLRLAPLVAVLGFL